MKTDDLVLAAAGGLLVLFGVLYRAKPASGATAPAPAAAGGTKRPSAPVVIQDDAEVLARAIHSEIGSGTREEKLAVAWTVRNLAKLKGKPIWQLFCNPCGRMDGANRPVSTRLPARTSDREIANLVLSQGESDDPTGGATQFLDLPGVSDYEATAKRWRSSYKWEPYKRIGRIETWGPSKTP